MTYTVDEYLRQLGMLKQVRQPYEPLWQDVTDYVLPRRSWWNREVTPGQKPETKMYDTTVLNCVQLLVDGIQGNLLSANLPWLHLVMEDRRLQNLPGVAQYLEQLQQIFLAEYARTNFYPALNEFITDAVALGTAVMFLEDNVIEQRIRFLPRHLKECYIAEDAGGRVHTVYRDFPMENQQAWEAWGKELCPQRLEQVKQNPYANAHILHVVRPRNDAVSGRWDPEDRRYAETYIDVDFKDTIEEGGYEHFPYLVWRWRKLTDERYGRGPGGDSIAEVLRLNQMAKSMLQSAQLANEPPLNVPEKLKGQERIVPRGYNYYSDPHAVITPINLGGNYPIGKDQEDQVREQIRDIFRTKIFLLMEQLEGNNYTATEIRERMGEKATVLDPTIARLSCDVLVPMVDRTHEILERNGVLPPPPAALRGGGRVHIEFQGPLAQAQERYQRSQGITAALPVIDAVMKLNPDSGDNVDFDELMREGMEAAGAPQKTIRDMALVQKLRQLQSQAMALQQQRQETMQAEQMIAANANKLNEPAQPGSMLAGMAKNMARRPAERAPGRGVLAGERT